MRRSNSSTGPAAAARFGTLGVDKVRLQGSEPRFYSNEAPGTLRSKSTIHSTFIESV
jgi:hypothetical protein